ncbi:hypothetical protein AJ80_05117 [Polytolypa hystricis UAMH7299]|uniref:Uncharacterized protein n=1 Tax=Polytolypa hystricis (strain UAMH7299) TaxID=1447883 RepID=A0A2B7Y5X9_POLH7|nr:hypothetical protein AJ80_05117 [Polytolypa hystricis UAMH7299]
MACHTHSNGYYQTWQLASLPGLAPMLEPSSPQYEQISIYQSGQGFMNRSDVLRAERELEPNPFDVCHREFQLQSSGPLHDWQPMQYSDEYLEPSICSE